jgi:hypothetical protein
MAFDAAQLAEIRAEINKTVAFPDLTLDLVTGKTAREVETARIQKREVDRANRAWTPTLPYVS